MKVSIVPASELCEAWSLRYRSEEAAKAERKTLLAKTKELSLEQLRKVSAFISRITEEDPWTE